MFGFNSHAGHGQCFFMDDKQRKDIQAAMNALLEMDARLAQDSINYVFTQLNSESFIGKINDQEYALLVTRAVSGLNNIIYLKHYSRDLVSKKAFAKAAGNLMILLYTRPLNGNDRDMLIEEFKSKQPNIIKSN
jgi:hypothetical protein